jgi:hypothetical protein
MKCEVDARRNFESVVGVVEKCLTKTEQETEAELYSSWLKEAKANPTFSLVSKEFPSVKSGPPPIGEGGSSYGHSFDYFGSTQDWTIRRDVLSPKTDFSQTPWGHDSQDRDVDAINVTIRCYRPCSIISRQTSLSITVHPAAKNPLLLNRLKTELDKAGLSYVVTED